MDNFSAFESALLSSLTGKVIRAQGPRAGDLTLKLLCTEDVVEVATCLCDAGLSFAMLVATDEQDMADRDFKVRYIFDPAPSAEKPPEDIFVTLEVSVRPENLSLPSVSVLIPSANWHEREAQDMFGLVFSGHPESRPLIVHDGWPQNQYPLRKAFDPSVRLPIEPAPEFPHLKVEGTGVLEVPVGPIHAGIIEPGHFRFSTIGEKVLHLDPRLFYTHRGLEKRMEGLTALDGFFTAERICGVCALSHGLGFCEAAEQIAQVDVPARAGAIRTLALELERLYNHVGDLGNICAGASFHYGTSAGARMKERLQQYNEQLTGNRFLRGLLVPGGVRFDLDDGLRRAIEPVLAATLEALGDLMNRVESNASLLDRIDTTGAVSIDDAVALGVTGIAARACGINRDARRDHPHGAYRGESGIRVRVATGTEGDVHARMILRSVEAEESIRLIRHFCSNLPSGSLCVDFPTGLPPFCTGISAIESPRGTALHWLRSDGKGMIDRYHLRSASFANWPILPIAARNDIIPDFPLINKSFELCYSCTDR